MPKVTEKIQRSISVEFSDKEIKDLILSYAAPEPVIADRHEAYGDQHWKEFDGYQFKKISRKDVEAMLLSYLRDQGHYINNYSFHELFQSGEFQGCSIGFVTYDG